MHINMNKIEYRQIGIIHSPFKTAEGTPIQPTGAVGIKGTVEVFPEYAEGLEDLDGFSHIILLYHCHLSKNFSLKVRPFLDNNSRGVFSTRAPSRPNSIGLSCVRLEKIDKGILYVQDVDVLDSTPLLDIKPYISKFDIRQVNSEGWIENRTGKIKKAQDDGRFKKLLNGDQESS
ncbi:MAG: tRNA (N6-threonylcarbamoyladenosine(37)-N6)-methyltransferase TrmO [Thermodesulfobacteriota bacterium]|nr:tRNA (N6-threonylcarbamoyladenosine(37)-N6)-methyltransferase TrmO [Thermodesulfobacteriota bacterium]